MNSPTKLQTRHQMRIVRLKLIAHQPIVSSPPFPHSSTLVSLNEPYLKLTKTSPRRVDSSYLYNFPPFILREQCSHAHLIPKTTERRSCACARCAGSSQQYIYQQFFAGMLLFFVNWLLFLCTVTNIAIKNLMWKWFVCVKRFLLPRRNCKFRVGRFRLQVWTSTRGKRLMLLMSEDSMLPVVCSKSLCLDLVVTGSLMPGLKFASMKWLKYSLARRLPAPIIQGEGTAIYPPKCLAATKLNTNNQKRDKSTIYPPKYLAATNLNILIKIEYNHIPAKLFSSHNINTHIKKREKEVSNLIKNIYPPQGSGGAATVEQARFINVTFYNNTALVVCAPPRCMSLDSITGICYLFIEI